MALWNTAKRTLKQRFERAFNPPLARAEARLDRHGLPALDLGPAAAIRLGLRWLCRAQDCSTSLDGGVARHYSLLDGWAPSYPETSGYIIPTLLDCRSQFQEHDLDDRAKKVLDWLCSIQMSSGAFQGGVIGAKQCVPVVFNTGQILIGLARGAVHCGDHYRDAMVRAADWLVAVQDSDGSWREHESPFARTGIKVYDTHTAWGLLEAARVEPNSRYAEAALANVDRALTHQRDSGWFENCCLSNIDEPLTHTIGYALRGIVEAYRFSREERYCQAACQAADGLLTAVEDDGFLPGRLDRNWRSTHRWACLTGSAQIAACWLLLHEFSQDERYLNAARSVNAYVRRTIHPEGPSDVVGAVKGSFPIDGGYRPYQFINWACKFMIDANLLEMSVTRGVDYAS